VQILFSIVVMGVDVNNSAAEGFDESAGLTVYVGVPHI
jgi:hypothetical protein